ncbi:hypothetical protein BGAFAR04_Ab0046 (plasmid) [Borreliella garinii Far04]|nr:hypothetical protein BGAFAR04_Ab0046 [Borreliella garinii Far04]
MSNGIIDGALKQIEKELKKLEEKKNKINCVQNINYEKQY